MGLVWPLLARDPRWWANGASCCLLCVTRAGVFGAAAASVRIFRVANAPVQP